MLLLLDIGSPFAPPLSRIEMCQSYQKKPDLKYKFTCSKIFFKNQQYKYKKFILVTFAHLIFWPSKNWKEIETNQ
jgi:hypothetical protein